MVTAPPVLEVSFLAVEAGLSRVPAHALADVGGGPGPVPATTVRFGFTREALFALFEAPAEPPLLVAQRAGGEVYRDECVELFVCSPGNAALYQEIVVNPAGALYGARVRNPDDSRATWQLAPGEGVGAVTVQVEGEPKGAPPREWTRWRCRIRLPWATLPGGRPPADREERRANATRIARGRTTRHLALSPTLRASPPDFHVPSRFARLVFRAPGR